MTCRMYQCTVPEPQKYPISMRPVVQVSVVNFLQYNVAGGGESALYGVEPASFYVFNGLLNFSMALPASLAFILVAAVSAARLTSARTSVRECAAMAPLFVMFPALLALPHKEERFLVVLYPQVRALPGTVQNSAEDLTDPKHSVHHGLQVLQITLGAALGVAAAPRIVSDMVIHSSGQASRDAVRRMVSIAAACVISLSCVMTTSRSIAVVQFYGAPTQAWQVVSKLQPAALPAAGPRETLRACVGAEWHRYSSSFFLPTGVELAFVEFGDTGMLCQPMPTLHKSFETEAVNTCNRVGTAWRLKGMTCTDPGQRNLTRTSKVQGNFPRRLTPLGLAPEPLQKNSKIATKRTIVCYSQTHRAAASGSGQVKKRSPHPKRLGRRCSKRISLTGNSRRSPTGHFGFHGAQVGIT